MSSSAKIKASAPFQELCNRFDQTLELGGERVFAEFPEGPITFAELSLKMAHLDTAFHNMGLAVGDRAAIFSKNDRDVVILFFSLLRSGLTPVIGDGDAKGIEIDECLEICRPAIVFGDRNILSDASVRASFTASRIIEIDGEDDGQSNAPEFTLSKLIETPKFSERCPINSPPETAMLVFTSGTTSKPKAVELTPTNLVSQLDIFAEVYKFKAGIKLLNLLPLHHVDGVIRGPLSALWFGGSVHRSIPFSVQNTPKILASISEQKITHFISVPAMLNIVERVGRTQSDVFQTPDFKFVLSSADLLTESLWRRFERTFDVPVANAYGLSEVVCDALFAGPDDSTRQIGTLGRPVGCNVEIMNDDGLPVTQGEVGELAISGPTVMKGYFENKPLTDQVIKNGKFLTGDYTRQTEEGLLQFVGRKKTAIVTAGVTIHPEAISSVLTNMQGIAEVVVFGVADSTRNQRLVAALVPENGNQITPADVADFCRKNLSKERTPSEFRILESLPRTASGKIQLDKLASIEPEKKANISGKDVLSIAAFCFDVPREKLSSDSTPFNTEGWDSLAHMTLIEEIELQFEIMFSATQIAQIASLGDAMKFVKEAVE